MTRVLAAVAAALAPLVLLPPPAVAATTTYHVLRDVRITMDDGVSLDSDQYIPDQGCPCPVILVQTPYRKSDTAVAEANPVFPQHGYAEIAVDVRGTGSSEGYWDSFGPREQKDSVALVNYAASRAYSNGRVGLAGISYSAINQLLTVEQVGTGAVRAIFPIVPMSDSYRDVSWAGGNSDTGFIPLWLGLVSGLGAAPADDAMTQPAIALNAESQHLYNITRFQAPVLADSLSGSYESQLPAQVQTYPDQSYDGPFYRVRSPIDHIAGVRVPTFIVGGEYDLFQRGEPILYRALNLPPGQKKFLFGPWYHVTAGSGLPASDSQGRVIPDLDTLQVAWFDRWLKGVANGVEAFPGVETYVQGSDRFEANDAFPAAGTRYQNWYLGTGGTLSRSAPAVSGGGAIPYNPAAGVCSRSTQQWTAGTAQTCSSDQRLNDAQGLAFTSPPMVAPLTISGPISAHLFISANRPDATVVATVEDVGPDGGSNSLTAGSLVASLRALTTRPCGPVVLDCTVYAGSQPTVPWHPYTRASQQPLEAGKIYEIWIEVFPTSARILPGHSLRLTLTGADVPHESPTLSTQADSAGAITNVWFGGGRPSSIYLGSV